MNPLPYDWKPPTECMICGSSELFDGFALCLEHALSVQETQGDDAVLKFTMDNLEREVRQVYLLEKLRNLQTHETDDLKCSVCGRDLDTVWEQNTGVCLHCDDH